MRRKQMLQESSSSSSSSSSLQSGNAPGVSNTGKKNGSGVEGSKGAANTSQQQPPAQSQSPCTPKIPDHLAMTTKTATATRQARQQNISPRVLVFEDAESNKSAIKGSQEPKKILLSSENKITSIPETSSPSSPTKQQDESLELIGLNGTSSATGKGCLSSSQATMSASTPPKTGAIQKKRSYRSQHSHSLKYSGSGTGECSYHIFIHFN